MDYTLTNSRSSLLTAITSAGNAISHISSSTAVSLPLIRIRMGNDDSRTTGMNDESISLKERRKRKRF